MTPQEEKQLLLKDLCARLPYDLIVQETFQNTKRDVPVWDCGPHYIKDHLEKVKPYLRPMSSMTEEEFDDFSDIIIPVDGAKAIVEEENIDKYVDFCNGHHFDYRGLIPMGLALEAPNDMYNTKTE